MMALRCPEFGCSAHVDAETYDGPVRCENGHTLRLASERGWRFLRRATEGFRG
jgi:hypothetical protein